MLPRSLASALASTLYDYFYQHPMSLLLVICPGDSKPSHFVWQNRTLQSCSEPRQLSFPDGTLSSVANV